MWKQRSRNSWLKEGDKNTKYFHYRANQRNCQNLILGLEDEASSWVENETEMSCVVERYFQDIFTSSNPSSFDTILGSIQRTMVDDLNPSMGGNFLAIEVQQALSQMAPLTTPGPNGMSPAFYKSFWHTMGEDVTAMVLWALNSGIVLESINTTFISLFPKIKNPKKVSDFRSISLCNVIYKLIANMIANQLKFFLTKSILDSQSAFLSGRLITDNILVAFKTFH